MAPSFETRTPDLDEFADLGPYERTLGITAKKTDDGSVCRMKYSPALIGSATLHGGTISALLKAAAAFAVLAQPTERSPALVSLTTRYLRPGKPEDAWARASITRKGGRVINVEATAWQDDPSRPIATAQACFVFEPAGSILEPTAKRSNV